MQRLQKNKFLKNKRGMISILIVLMYAMTPLSSISTFLDQPMMVNAQESESAISSESVSEVDEASSAESADATSVESEDASSAESEEAPVEEEESIHFSANDYKTEHNTWSQAIQAAFNAARAIANKTNSHANEYGSQFWVGPTPFVTIEPGEYEIDQTIIVYGLINFDFTGAKFIAAENQYQKIDAIDAIGQSFYNIYRLPEFHGFRRGLRFSTQNRDRSLIDISGGGFYDTIVGVDDVSYLSSRSTVISIHDFVARGTDQVIRTHADNAHIYNFDIEHTGWDGSAIFSQARVNIEDGVFTTQANETGSTDYGLIEQWTSSDIQQLVNPAINTIEDHDIGNRLRGAISGTNRGVIVNDVTVNGNVPLIVWQGEAWQNVSTSNALKNHVDLHDITLENHNTNLVVINRDLPNNVRIENVTGYNDENPYLFFSPASTDRANQYSAYLDAQAFDEHQVESEAWQYRIYFGRGNDATESNVSNDPTVNQFVYEPYRQNETVVLPDTYEKINLTDAVNENRSIDYINAATYKTNDNTWTQAIQAAIDDAAANADGRRPVVTLPPDVYTIESTIQLPDSVDIDFIGSKFLSTTEQIDRVDYTAINALSNTNHYGLPEFIGFDVAFQFSTQGIESAMVKIHQGGFYNNRIDIDDSGFENSGKATVEISNVRSGLSDTFLNISSNNARVHDFWVTNNGSNTGSINSNARLMIDNFVFVPYPAIEATNADAMTWVALYNDAEGMSDEERNMRGLYAKQGVMGGEKGSVVNVRSYMTKTDGNAIPGEYNNHIVLYGIQSEAGNDGILPRAAMAIHQDLPSYIELDMMNGMSVADQGYIAMAEESSTLHHESQNPNDYIIFKAPGSDLTRPAYVALSEDTTLDQYVYRALPMTLDLSTAEITAEIARVGQYDFIHLNAGENSYQTIFEGAE